MNPLVVFVAVLHIYPFVTGQGQTLTSGRSAHLSLQLLLSVFGRIRTCLGVSRDPMFLWISLNSCPLNLPLVQSHQAEIIIEKRLYKDATPWPLVRVLIEPGSCDQESRKDDAFTSATLPIQPRLCHWVLNINSNTKRKTIVLQLTSLKLKDDLLTSY